MTGYVVTVCLNIDKYEMIVFNFMENPKHTHSYAKFIVDSISENRFNVSCL